MDEARLLAVSSLGANIVIFAMFVTGIVLAMYAVVMFVRINSPGGGQAYGITWGHVIWTLVAAYGLINLGASASLAYQAVYVDDGTSTVNMVLAPDRWPKSVSDDNQVRVMSTIINAVLRLFALVALFKAFLAMRLASNPAYRGRDESHPGRVVGYLIAFVILSDPAGTASAIGSVFYIFRDVAKFLEMGFV